MPLEADFQPGSFGYRPKRSAHEAVHRVTEEVARGKTLVIDVDLRAHFDGVRHDLLLAEVAKRVEDADALHLLKLILKASGKIGVPQGGALTRATTSEIEIMSKRLGAAERQIGWTHIDSEAIRRDGRPASPFPIKVGRLECV